MSGPQAADPLPPAPVDLVVPAVVRVALVPVVLVGGLLVDRSRLDDGAFGIVLAAFAVWAGGLLAIHLAERRPAAQATGGLASVEPFVDLAAIVGLTYTSGGPFSETATALFVLPLLAAFRLRPRLAAGWTVAAMLAFALLSLVHPARSEPEATGRIISQVAYLGWTGAAATLLSGALARRDAAIARLIEGRTQLAVHALSAEQRERRRLAESLHDEAIPTLSVARQELLEYRRTSGPDAFERAESAIRSTMAQLRGEIFELHPYVLDHAGLPAALRAIAERWAARMDAEVSVAVDPAAAGAHDELLVVLARELLSNAAQHSHATRVVLTVASDAERVELTVRDNGIGFDPARRASALAHGHIGLASSDQRIRSSGGELMVQSTSGQGTTVRATLPFGERRNRRR